MQGLQLAATETIVALSAGSFHTCVLTSSGGVQCWGGNDGGQLGNTCPTTPGLCKSPVAVQKLATNVKAISGGGAFTCALTLDGAIQCWGYNDYGQLGTDPTATPTSVEPRTIPVSGATVLAAGYAHACALTSAGLVKCWGENEYTELGDGTVTASFSFTPISVKGLSPGIASLAAGAFHTCALNSTSTGVACWGYNGESELGDHSTATRSGAVDVLASGGAAALSGAAAIASGAYHACALASTGAVKCWGDNGAGQLGDGLAIKTPSNSGNASSPIDVTGLASVVALSAGESFTCAITSSRTVKCWGMNDQGQLGDGNGSATASPSSVPVLVKGL